MAFHELVISGVRQEGADAVALEFAMPQELVSEFAYVPGQYLTLRTDIDGQDVRRSYSIASAPDAPLCVGVRQVDDGLFSTYAQGLKAGDTVQVMPPEGRFMLQDQQDILLIAAGSGITPMVSIANAALVKGVRVTLVYGNRDFKHVMFRSELEALKDQYMGRFTLIHILSREEQDIPLLNGRITGDKIERMAKAGAIDLGAADGVFLCGPGEMITDVSAVLSDLGVAENIIHSERFTPDGEAPRKRSKAAQAVAESGVEVEVILDGSRKKFRVEEGDENIVAAAARQGLELPYSCKGGMCCTCRCRVTEGSAEMAVNYALEPWELEAGFTLACQTRPTSEKLVLDFDAA
ncbi:2Fe-2S iron-sulfur cluster-binding protein [Profundibacter sp.]|uniref:2Fe-2S iron-sulfur cluster-binding protein n=1 Tax=Profundibacter sp. TaxID=3101071 RepID=UPI003D0C28FB